VSAPKCWARGPLKRIRKWLSSTNNQIPISNIQGQNIENHATKIQNCLQKRDNEFPSSFEDRALSKNTYTCSILKECVNKYRHDRLHIKNYVNSWIHENYLPVIFCHFMFHKIILFLALTRTSQLWRCCFFFHSHTHGISIVSRLCLWPARLFMFLLIFNEQRVPKFTFVLVLTYYVNCIYL
jgi:hypothetical protein